GYIIFTWLSRNRHWPKPVTSILRCWVGLELPSRRPWRQNHSGFDLQILTCTLARKERPGSIGRKPVRIQPSRFRILGRCVEPSRRTEFRHGKETRPDGNFPILVGSSARIHGEIPWNFCSLWKTRKRCRKRWGIMPKRHTGAHLGEIPM